jgi:hypothetical protein
MTQADAAKLTLEQLQHNYARVLSLHMPEGMTPDAIYQLYQDRPVALPADIHHTSMSVGDIVLIGRTVCICCKCGWYKVELSNIPDERRIRAG